MRTMGGAWYGDNAIIPSRPVGVRARGRVAISFLILITMLVSSFIAVTASITGTGNITTSSLQDSIHYADADFVRHVLCSWGTTNAENSEKSGAEDRVGSDDEYVPSTVRLIYQLTQTEDLHKALDAKSQVGAESSTWWSPSDAMTGKDFDAITLDIVNTQNGGDTKYTPYDRFGFSSLKWSAYMGEWNWIKVYYCGANGTGDDDKDPEDPKLNLFYPDRNRPLDQYADRFSSTDPRVQLKSAPIVFALSNNYDLNIANFIFSITKFFVSLNNVFIGLSFSNVAQKMGLDKVAASIMTNLLNGLFVPLAAFVFMLTGIYVGWIALAKRQFSVALKSLLQTLVCFFLGYLMLAAPTVFANLPNAIGSTLQFVTMSAMTNTIQGGSSDMCSTDVTSSTITNDDSIDIFKGGKINSDAIRAWTDKMTDSTSRTVTCQFWRLFALMPWALGQYGTDVGNLYASGYAVNGGKELNPDGTQGDWVGLAAVPLGNGQVYHNWAVYQISAQSMDHIPSTIADASTGKIENTDKVEYTNVQHVRNSGRVIDSTNGDWWRVVDAVSGYDTVNKSDTDTENSTSAVNKSVATAQDNYNSGNAGDDQIKFIIDAYNANGVSISPASNVDEFRTALEGAGFHKIEGDVDYTRGDGLKPGDVLLSSSGNAAMYTSGAQAISQSGTKGTDGDYNEAWRMGNGGSASSVPGSSAEDVTAFAGSDELLRYRKLDGADLTPYWGTWIGANAWTRKHIAFLSLVALVAMVIPLVLGGAIVVLACASVILMAFAPIALLMGLWAGSGNKIVHDYLEMTWSVIVRRVAYGLLYVIILAITTKIFASVTGFMDYLKAIILAVFLGYAVYSNREKIVSFFSKIMHANDDNAAMRVGKKATSMTKDAGRLAGATAGGAALGAVKRKKIYETDPETGKEVLDKWGNKHVIGHERYGATDKNGKVVHGRLRQTLSGARQGASMGAKTQVKQKLYTSEFGRQALHTHDQNKSLRTRRKMRAELAAQGLKGDDLDSVLRSKTGQPCIMCGKKYLPQELTSYSSATETYYVCKKCIKRYSITSAEGIEEQKGLGGGRTRL